MEVPIPCICPNTPHEGDTVTLADALHFRQATTARNAVYLLRAQDDEASIPEIMAVLTEHYLLLGITGWTLTDEDGKPRPATRAAIREHLLTEDDAATMVGDAADDLYGAAVMRPLLRKASSSSEPSPTTEPTSPSTGTGSPTPSSLSSTTTTPTDDTETTSSPPAGGSSSSPSLASVA